MALKQKAKHQNKGPNNLKTGSNSTQHTELFVWPVKPALWLPVYCESQLFPFCIVIANTSYLPINKIGEL